MIAAANAVILSGWTLPASHYAKRICHALRGCAIIAPSHANGPVHEKHQSEAAATLAVKQGFATSESQVGAGASCDCLTGFGRGGPTRKDGRTASDVFFTPRPPDALENADGGFVHVPEGIDMTRTTSTKGQTARTQTTPKTTREPVAGLNWFVEVKGPRGKYLGQYELAFPAEEFLPGTATGYRAAGELLARLEQWGALTPADVHTLFRLALEKPEAGGTSDAGARFALRDVMYQALKFLAAKAQYGAWLDRRIAEAERFARQDAEREQQRIQRSIAARRAKREARKAAKVEGGVQ